MANTIAPMVEKYSVFDVLIYEATQLAEGWFPNAMEQLRQMDRNQKERGKQPNNVSRAT